MIFQVALAVLISILGLACSTSPIVPTVSPDGIPEEEYAPNFKFTLLRGNNILGTETEQLAELRGTPVVLNFWARLCAPCWVEMPELQEFSIEFEEEILVLGIDIGQFTGLGSLRDSSKLLDSIGITYPVGFTDDGTVVERYEVQAMPTTVFIDQHGKIFQTWTGALDRGIVTRLAKSMLIQGAN